MDVKKSQIFRRSHICESHSTPQGRRDGNCASACHKSVDRTGIDIGNRCTSIAEEGFQPNLLVVLLVPCGSEIGGTLRDHVMNHNKPVGVAEIHWSRDQISAQDIGDDRGSSIRLLIVNNKNSHITSIGGIVRRETSHLVRLHRNLATHSVRSTCACSTAIEKLSCGPDAIRACCERRVHIN